MLVKTCHENKGFMLNNFCWNILFKILADLVPQKLNWSMKTLNGATIVTY
jgi:hypothetical protein